MNRSQVGRLSRRKGKTFERLVVRLLKQAGLEAVRGYWQSRGGEEVPDVQVPGLWIECGHGNAVDPVRKLAQAVKNLGKAASGPGTSVSVLPVALTRRTGARQIFATMRLGDLMDLMDWCDESVREAHPQPITMGLRDWISLAREKLRD